MMKLKKSIAWILAAVLILTVVSGAVLYLGGDQSGSVTSTDKVKYDYVVDNSSSLNKIIDSGARNGSLKTIGGGSSEYVEYLVSTYVDQNVTDTLEPLTYSSNNSILNFYLRFPFVIDFIASSYNFHVYLCWNRSDYNPDEEDPVFRYYLGYGQSSYSMDYPIPGYGGDECWIEVSSNYNITIRYITIKVKSILESSPVSAVYSLGKNQLNLTNAYSEAGYLYVVSDGSVFMSCDTEQTLYINLDLPPGVYTFSCSSDDVYYAWINDEKGQSTEVDPGHPFYLKNGGILLTVYFDFSYTFEEDQVVSELQIECGYDATEYEPYREPELLFEVPKQVMNLPYYGLGDKNISNYIDLERGLYVQACSLVDNKIYPLVEPKIYDISAWIPPGSDAIDLYGVSVLYFKNSYDLDIPSELSYRRVIN